MNPIRYSWRPTPTVLNKWYCHKPIDPSVAIQVQECYTMYMNRTLEKALDKARNLSTGDQRELANLIVNYTQSVVDGEKFQDDMKDSKYESFVSDALERGRMDVKAGSTYTAEQVLNQSKDRLKKLHG